MKSFLQLITILAFALMAVGCSSTSYLYCKYTSDQQAVSQITDQANLAKIAQMNTDADMRRIAIARLTDQDVLAQIAQEDEDWDARKGAVSRLTDQSLLAQVALKAMDEDIRLDAIDKLTDQTSLAQVALADLNWSVSEVVSERIRQSHQDDLARLRARHAADRQMLLRDSHHGSQNVAVARILHTKQTELEHALAAHYDNVERVLTKHEERIQRSLRRLVDRLTDPDLLAQVAQQAKDPFVRRLARTRGSLRSPATSIKRQVPRLLD